MTEPSSSIDLSSIDIKGAVESMYVPKEERVLDPSKADASLIERMPSPTGWRMLILPYRGKGKTSGGVYLPDKVVDDGQLTTVVGYVIAGPAGYKDEVKFPAGPWCATGDWVIFARYAGSRFRIEGGEVRILNDDEILAVISDPEDILSL
uniref:Co-chaperonin GroES n=1 Tax=uncultured virus TaxID=340016 RepID=A0A221S3F0_9VIRU|nr:co-chaperonin GroES [uncultured virus]